MVVAPGVEPGHKITAPIYLQDAMATTLDLAGIAKPDHVEFHSLLPMLAGQPSPYKSIYGGYLKVQRCVRTDEYKLILYPDAKVARLFNLRQDPDEMIDLAEQPAALPIMKQLFAELLRHQAELEDTLELRNTFRRLL
jgi:choline-sulfatase